MNCPVCNRNNAVTLSICPSCGAMINDSVREELVTKISPAAKPVKMEIKEKTVENIKPSLPVQVSVPAPIQKPVVQKTITTELTSKQTNPTLIEFHNKNAAVPEWRLQLQNAVQQRKGGQTAIEAEPTSAQTTPVRQTRLVTSGANALKAETAVQPLTEAHKNPTLNSALERIARSRRQFLEEEEKPAVAPEPNPAPKAAKNYPFYIATKTNEPAATPKPAEPNPQVAFQHSKPKLASSLKLEREDFDTNKLPPIPKPAAVSTSFATRPVAAEEFKTKVEPPKKEIENIEPVEIEETELQEYDDCAPLAMRFNAGLFDLIIGTFLSLFLLSPFMLLGGSWLSFSGFFAFAATCAIVMFIYLTTTIGLYGRTFGMRLFALEVVDIEGENYPTLHQAAVSSSVYLLSLALGGIGFLTLPFTEEKRAVHDIVSGTIIVREE